MDRSARDGSTQSSGVLKRFLVATAVVPLLLATCACSTLWRPSVADYDALETTTAPTASTRLSLTFLGTSSIAIHDGRRTVLIDGFISRPSASRFLLLPLRPDRSRIERALASFPKPSAVFVAHSHFDHAMDAATISNLTGARLFGSQSMAIIAQGEGVPYGRFSELDDGDAHRFGDMTVTSFETPHSPDGWAQGEVVEFEPPADWSRYRGGGSYSFLIEAGDCSVLVAASAGEVGAAFQDVRADLVLLSVAALGDQGVSAIERYWLSVVGEARPKLVVPIHWDDFTYSLDEPFVALPHLVDSVGFAMEEVDRLAERNRVPLRLAQPMQVVDLERLLGCTSRQTP